MNNKLLSFVLGLAVIGALTSLHFYKSSSSPSSSSRVSWSTDDLSLGLQEFLPDAKELAYRISLFKTWIEEYKKSYSAFEAPMRFKIWNKNYDFVQEHNAKNLSWTVEMNKFADLSTEEFSALHLGFRLTEDAIKAHEESVEILDESLTASSIDWRLKGAVSSIKNQQQCGGCWAFASAAALEGLDKIKNGGTVKDFSPQQLIDCSGSYGNQGCGGGTMTATYQYTKAKGIELWSSYPFTGSEGSCRYSSSRVAFRNNGYQSVANSYTQLQAAVTKGPVTVAVEADQSAFQMYKSGVIKSGCGTNLDHAILAVGFTETYWIVKNQWGASWGNNGYVYIAKGSSNVCGINSMASYPTY